MEQDNPLRKRSYDKYGFCISQKQQQAINYLIDSDAEEQRSQRWRKLLPQIEVLKDGGKQSQRRLLNAIRKGIDDSMRHLVWPQIICKPIKPFQECVNRRDLKEIILDLDRTFPLHKEAKSIGQRMKIVLNAIAYAFPKVGYCQGMNFIVGTLLLKLSDQETFNVACHIIYWKGHEFLLTNLDLIHQKLYALDKLISKHYSKLSKHLKQYQIQTTLFAPPWFITLYCNSLPASYAFRILECYLMEGEKVIYRVALQILKMKKKVLKSLNRVEKIIEQLKNFDQLLEPNIDSFFEEMYKINLSRSDINYYIAQYKESQAKKSQ